MRGVAVCTLVATAAALQPSAVAVAAQGRALQPLLLDGGLMRNLTNCASNCTNNTDPALICCDNCTAAGGEVAAGNVLTVDYIGYTDDPLTPFDSSIDRGEAFEFVVGDGSMIEGWEVGFVGLCLGAKATLVVPPEMAYGQRGSGKIIPPGATLNFDVEVVSIANSTAAHAARR